MSCDVLQEEELEIGEKREMERFLIWNGIVQRERLIERIKFRRGSFSRTTRNSLGDNN